MLLVDVPPADWSLLVTGLMIVSLKDRATDLVSALSMASRSPLETDLWKVELELRPPESPPSDWKPSRRGSTLPSLLPRPPSRLEAKEGTDRRLCRLPWDSTSDTALLFSTGELNLSSSLM